MGTFAFALLSSLIGGFIATLFGPLIRDEVVHKLDQYARQRFVDAVALVTNAGEAHLIPQMHEEFELMGTAWGRFRIATGQLVAARTIASEALVPKLAAGTATAEELRDLIDEEIAIRIYSAGKVTLFMLTVFGITYMIIA